MSTDAVQRRGGGGGAVHIASTAFYTLTECLEDLLELAAVLLVQGERWGVNKPTSISGDFDCNCHCGSQATRIVLQRRAAHTVWESRATAAVHPADISCCAG